MAVTFSTLPNISIDKVIDILAEYYKFDKQVAAQCVNKALAQNNAYSCSAVQTVVNDNNSTSNEGNEDGVCLMECQTDTIQNKPKVKIVVSKRELQECRADLKPIVAWAKANTFRLSQYDGQASTVQGHEPKELERIEGNKWRKIWKNDCSQTGQWTTIVGEGLVKVTLEACGYRVWKPEKKEGFEPDWETNDFIVEVKSRTWNTTGTAGEKVLGTPLKYAAIPRVYKKPLIIILVAYQEHELRHGKTKIIGEEVKFEQKQILEFYNTLGISYYGLTDLFREIGW